MDMSGYSARGFKRKLAVQALFGKVYYLSEVIGLKAIFVLPTAILLFVYCQFIVSLNFETK